ncbi:MAG TPA: hypothetical protein VGO59_12340 [Verrucomicrobiae bacterium]
MFSLIGVLLVAFGAATGSDADMYSHTSLGININLIWGIVLLIFGVAMLLGAISGRKKPPAS